METLQKIIQKTKDAKASTLVLIIAAVAIGVLFLLLYLGKRKIAKLELAKAQSEERLEGLKRKIGIAQTGEEVEKLNQEVEILHHQIIGIDVKIDSVKEGARGIIKSLSEAASWDDINVKK